FARRIPNGLLDDLGIFADVWVYAYAQLLGRLEIEDDLVLIEALDPEVARFCSLENAIDEAGRACSAGGYVRVYLQHNASLRRQRFAHRQRDLVLLGQLGEELFMDEEERALQRQNGIHAVPLGARDSAFQVFRLAHIERLDCDIEFLGRGFYDRK